MDSYSVNSADQPISAVSDLATSVSDIVKGYSTMVDKAEPDLKPVVERLHGLHTSHLGVLTSLISELGGRPDDLSSPMGNVHKTVAIVRDWMGALDASALDPIADGEERLVDEYTDAISHLVDHPAYQQKLEEQRDAIRDEVAQLRG